MGKADVQKWLLENEGFQEQYNRLLVDSVSGQFGGMIRSRSSSESDHDWNYLLFCASLLAQSDDPKAQSVSLRISQYCLESLESSHYKDAAAVVLDSLANQPAIKLAEDRKLLDEGYVNRIGFTSYQDWMRRSFQNSITSSSSGTVHVNKFQKSFWNSVDANDWISVSAPTSVGKSFIITRWISEFIKYNPKKNIVYLVPTRALIHQVQRDIEDMLSSDGLNKETAVVTLPLPSAITEGITNVFVFTQERFHILLGESSIDFGLLISDEAQKIGDNNRGVLLQQAIETALSRNGDCKVLFASPMTENPEIFLEDMPREKHGIPLVREDTVVNQNLIWVSQVHGKPESWNVELIVNSDPVQVGTIELPARPSPDSKRLSFVSFVLGNPEGGNVVYVNGAADAEKTGKQFYDLLNDDLNLIGDSEINDLIDLAKKTIHKKYFLSKLLHKGVAFHYGNMPLLIRNEVERLFGKNKIKYLICTSTLIEGINMPCRNIFVRGPSKGRGRPMEANDFWNLAGRAGRWGKEFQGNVICIDAYKENVWKNGTPKARKKYPIVRASDEVLKNEDSLLEFIENKTPRAAAASDPELEYVFSYLTSTYLNSGKISSSSWAKRYSSDYINRMDEELENILSSARTPHDVILKNPGISLVAMDGLLGYFDDRTLNRNEDIEGLLPIPPESDGAVDHYAKILHRINKYLANNVFGRGNRVRQLALLIVDWMKGYPLARIISSRENFYRDRGDAYKLDALIRETMSDVESVARFQAPKYLACYTDLLKMHLQEQGRQDLISGLLQLNVLLEFGVSQTTQLSLMGLGLSRSSAITISELITDDSLSENGCVKWLTKNDWMTEDLPEIIKREISDVLGRATVET